MPDLLAWPRGAERRGRRALKGAGLWARADIRARWFPLVVLALLVAGAFGATLALVAGARRAGSATERFTEASDLAEITVFVEGEPSPELLAAIAADHRITGADRSDIVTITPDPVEPGSGGMTAIGQPGAGPGGLGRPLLLGGRYPSPEATDEVLVNERAALRYGLRPGDRRTLSGLACLTCEPAAVPGEVTITGVVRLANDLVDDPATESLILAPPRFLDGQWTDQVRPGTILWVRVANPADALDVAQDLSGVVTDGDVSNNIAALDVAIRAGDVQRNALLVAAAVVGLATVIVLAHAMSRHVSVRQRDEPILDALGLGTSQRWAAAATLIAPAVGAGSVGAGIVAVVLSPIFPLGLARRAEPDLGLRIDVPVLVLGTLVTLLAAAAVAAFVSRRWLERDGKESGRASLVSRTLTAVGLPPVPLTGGRFALERGVGPSRLPTRSTLVAVVTAMAVIGAAMVLRSSLDGLASTPGRFGQPWALIVGTGDAPPRSAAEQLALDPRILAVDLVAQGELDLTTAAGRRAQIGSIGIEGIDGPTQLALLDGRAPNGLGEIALGSVTMSDLGVGVGDEVTASGPCGTRRLNVTGRVIVPLVGGDTPDDGSVVTLDGFDELCADQLIADIDNNRGAMLRLRDDASVGELEAELATQGLFVQRGSRPSSVASLLDIRGVPLLVAGVVGALGLAAAAYALVLSVRRRRSELAVLRALGLGPGQAGRVITAQAVSLVLVAIALGLPLGILLGKVLWTAIAEPSNVLVRTELGAGTLLLVGVASAVLVLAMSLWPSLRARRIDVAAVLRSE